MDKRKEKKKLDQLAALMIELGLPMSNSLKRAIRKRQRLLEK